MQAAAKREVSRGYQEEEEHWAWCIRQNPNNTDPDVHPRCYPKLALGDAVIALTANVAAKKGQKTEFNEKWFEYLDKDGNPVPDTPDGSTIDLNREKYNV